MQNIVHLKELRENLAKYADRVAKGDSFVVMKRSKALFKLSPIEDSGWETVIDFTELYPNGISAKTLLDRMHEMQ